MPERPKRRKNNKNKRKINKNNRWENADNNSSSSASASVPLLTVDNVVENDIENQNEGFKTKESCDMSEVNAIPVEEICYETKSEIPFEHTKNLINYDDKLLIENKESCEEPTDNYVVELPDQNKSNKSKLSNTSKSKSVDDDSPTIVEITDESNLQSLSDNTLHLIDSADVLISDAECEVLWHKTDDLVDINSMQNNELIENALPISTVSLNTALCHQTKSLSPEEESSLRCYLKTLNLSANPDCASSLEIKSEIEQIINNDIKYRLRKRGLADDLFIQRVGPSRSLTVIDEEGSCESSITSRRQSSLIDKKSDTEDLEDEVFEPKTSPVKKCGNGKKGSMKTYVTPQECIRVDAKLKEPEITEARGGWTTKIVEKITGAEIVYLTDSSSSTSSIYDGNEDNENSEDSDQCIRIITPTIEVTDTEKLLTDLSITETRNSNKSKLNMSINNEEKEVNENNNNMESEHEILVESTENIVTDLTVKDIIIESEECGNLTNESRLKRSPKAVDKYDLEIKVLKCELNDAINNLIKEVSSDSESVKDSNSEELIRQDSSSSVGSSQCTAKYNPTHSSLNDISNEINDSSEHPNELSSHVKDVLNHVRETTLQNMNSLNSVNIRPQSLKDICLQNISSMPYGDKIIEELAQVSSCLQNLNTLSRKHINSSKISENSEFYQVTDKLLNKRVPLSILQKELSPPPLLPRKSSLKKSQDENKPIVPSKPEYKCLSPSQKMLMEKSNIVKNKDQIKKSVHTLENNLRNKNVESNSNENYTTKPFKSQTGSRLLSLLCDTSINSNISSSSTFNNKPLDQISKCKNIESFTSCGSKTEYKSTKPKLTLPKHSIFSYSSYESDDSSEVAQSFYKNIRDERKYFHYSTGNLNSDIENDISSIQDLHRYYTHKRNENLKDTRPRRPSLPKDLCDQQMEYILQKEKEVDAEICRLELEKVTALHKRGTRAPMIQKSENLPQVKYDSIHLKDISYKANKPSCKPSSLFSNSEEELLREKMYSEYVNQMAERQFRKEHKVIKMSKPLSTAKSEVVSQSMPILDSLDSKVNNRMEQEFITRARERWDKLGIKDFETEDNSEIDCDLYSEPKVMEHKIKVIEAGEEKDVNKLPNHLKDFVKFTAVGKEKKTDDTGESEAEKRPTHVVIMCAVIILMLTIRKYFLRLLRNNQ